MLILLLLAAPIAASLQYSAPTVEVALGAIVRLHDPETGRAFCSGVIVSDTLLLTAAHCVGEEVLGIRLPRITLVEVRNSEGRKVANAIVKNFLPRNDQAALEGDFTHLPHIPMELDARGLHAAFQHKVIACGYPYGESFVCSELTDMGHYGFLMGAQGFLFPGMSGGPVIDMYTGRVIALNSAVSEHMVLLAPIFGIMTILGLR